RFRYERQILAGLDHPGVARLLDAGAAPDGRPYLVMELVEGAPLTAYAEARGLGLEARLSLFEEVCAAVAYAHRHLVVHRDLKPSNILVGEGGGGAPRVKLLDFGVARLLETDAEATHPAARFLTPAFAAPEQRRGEPDTTAADVYALGAILYLLLTGTRPGRDPAPPSSIPADPARRRALRGDLDTLVLTALHPDPTRRYASAEALLDDLRRRRTGLPLNARPDALGYRLRKFVGRHRWGVGVSALAVVFLVAFAAVLLVQQQQTAHALAESEATAAFLESLFAAADPYAEERLDTLRASALLARGGERARRELAEQPALQARLLSLIGTTYLRLNLDDEARVHLDEALATRRALYGDQHRATAETRRALGSLEQQQGNYEDAEQHLTAALATYRRLGPEDPATLGAAHDLAVLYEDLSRYEEAEALLRELEATYRQQRGGDLDLAKVLHTLALVLRDQERFDEAEPVAREALAIQQAAYGEEHPANAATLVELGAILRGQDDLEAAEQAYRTSLAIYRRTLGDAHRETEIGRTHLAELLKDRGQHAEAAALYREVLDRARETVGEEHPGVAIIGALLAGVYLAAGQLDDAEATYREAIDRMGTALPPGHVRTARATVGLGTTLTAQRRYDEAEAVLLDAHRLFQEGGHDPSRAADRLASLYEAWNRPDEAARWRPTAD
ncbi:MAG: tetratricopeptide repeat protein, partial [Rubricoccaceae bacterium]|nr:tetratricopeptide repeat protein [Rubricoccaceae bacterium]